MTESVSAAQPENHERIPTLPLVEVTPDTIIPISQFAAQYHWDVTNLSPDAIYFWLDDFAKSSTKTIELPSPHLLVNQLQGYFDQCHRGFLGLYQDNAPLPYHDAGHSCLTALFVAQMYLGYCDQSKKPFHPRLFELLIATACYHEIDDWWHRSNGNPDHRQKYQDLVEDIARYLTSANLSTDDFNQLLAFYQFDTDLAKIVRTAKQSKHPRLLADNHCLSVLPTNLDERRKLLLALGKISRGADFCQVTNSSYQHVVKLVWPDSFTEVNAGSIVLAWEMHLLGRTNAISKVGWAGANGQLDWHLVTTSPLFIRNIAAPAITAALPYLSDPTKTTIIANCKFLEHLAGAFSNHSATHTL